MRPASGAAFTLDGVTHIEFIPTTDGRNIIYRGVVVPPRERLRRWVRRLRTGR
jgi:hypothetical protein